MTLFLTLSLCIAVDARILGIWKETSYWKSIPLDGGLKVLCVGRKEIVVPSHPK